MPEKGSALIEFNCPQCGQKLTADKTMSQSLTLCPTCEQAIRVPRFNLYPGLQLGDFVLKVKLGTGGMGEVWLAEQKSMQRDTALKILAPELADNQDFCMRFQHEAKNSGKLLHPNIVTAFYAGVENDIHYLAMSYVEGIPLDVKLEKSHTIPEIRALHIIKEVAEALKYAWNQFKIIHRDIKPSNIMLARDGSVKLLDLGISKSIAENDMLTKTGLFVGTPYYVSPEQAKNDPGIDFRTDMYSLGAVLYHMLSGNCPYQATTPLGVVAQHLSEPLPDIRGKNPIASESVWLLIRKMMAKDRDDRFADWDELIEAINQTLAHPVPDRPLIRQNHKTSLRFIILIGTAISVIAAAAVIVSTSSGDTAVEKSDDNDPSGVEVIASAEENNSLPGKDENAPTGSNETFTQPAKDPGIEVRKPINIIMPDLRFLENELNLTPKQVMDIKILVRDARLQALQLQKKFFKAPQPERQAIRKELLQLRNDAFKRISSLLTPEQKDKLHDIEKRHKKSAGNAR